MKKYNISRFIILIFAVFAFAVLSSCRKKCYDASNPECENYNPCFSAQATSADFKIEENMYATKRFYECDTCIQRTLYFTAKQELDSFQWKIGNDPRLFGGKQFVMELDEKIPYVDVQLIVWKKEPDKKCFPNDSGSDTLKKRVYFYKNEEWPVLGKYNGYYESNPNDTFTITVGYFPLSSDPNLKYFAIRGLKDDVNGKERDINAITTYAFSLYQRNSLKGYIIKDGYLDKVSKQLNLEFAHPTEHYDEMGNPKIEIRKFVGRKVQ